MRKKQREGNSLREVPLKKTKKRINKTKFVFGLVLIFLITYISITLYNIHNLKQQENARLERQEQLKAEKVRLQKELGQVNSPQYIEQIARSTLKMVKKGEILYVIPGAEKSNNNSTSIGAFKTDNK